MESDEFLMSWDMDATFIVSCVYIMQGIVFECERDDVRLIPRSSVHSITSKSRRWPDNRWGAAQRLRVQCLCAAYKILNEISKY